MQASKPLRAALYARVSTADQTTENQLVELRRYAEARAWQATEYVDQGVSGAKAADARAATGCGVCGPRACDVASVPPHHSFLLNDLRVPAKIAQELLGHASIFTTLGIYTHVVDASHRAAVTAVEERLFGVMLRSRQQRLKTLHL